MKAGKILSFLVGGVIAVVVLVLVSVWLLVNPNLYKAKIVAAVKDATGRDLILQGDIKLSVFPWIALELGPASLSNPVGPGDAAGAGEGNMVRAGNGASRDAAAGFSEQPFVSFKHAAVRAKLLPLLRQRLEIARVEIDGLDVRLQKNGQGHGNWEGFGRSDSKAADATPAADASPAEGEPAVAGKPLEGLAGIKITNARLSYQNFALENFNLETTPFVDGVVPIVMHFDANRGVATEHATVEAKVDFSNPSPGRYRVAALTLAGQVNLAGNNRPVHWNLSAPGVDVDLNAQTLAVPGFGLMLAGAQLNGSVQGTRIVDEPALTGSVTLAQLVVREYLPRWDITPPQTRDPRALSQVAGSLAFAYGGDALRVEKLKVTLDDTHVEGSASAEKLSAPVFKFALSADTIDLDHYLAPEGEAPTAGSARGVSRAPATAPGTTGTAGAPMPASAAAGASTPATARVPASAATSAKDGDPSRPLQADGTLSVGSVHFSRLNLTDLRLTLAAKDGVARIFPLQAEVDGGRYSGDIGLDSRGAVPLFSMDEHLTGVDIGRLLASNGKSIKLSGKGNFSVKATGRGAAADEIVKTLNGHVDANVADGAVEGIDLGFELARAEALIKREGASAMQNTHRTQFDAFKVSADIANGVARTNDLTISSKVLRVTGQGSTNLVNNGLDFQLLANTLRTTQGVPIQIPVKVTGTTSDPTIRPDIEALAKGQLRQKLQDVLKDKLQGLFGKP